VERRLVRACLEPNTQRDTLMLADFLSGASLESERTFFEDIRRLPSGHWMYLNQTEVTIRMSIRAIFTTPLPI